MFRSGERTLGGWELQLEKTPVQLINSSKPAHGQITFRRALHALHTLERPASFDEILLKIEELYLVHLGNNASKTLAVALRDKCSAYWKPRSKQKLNLFVAHKQRKSVLWSLTEQGAAFSFADVYPKKSVDEERQIIARHIKFERNSIQAGEFLAQLEDFRCKACLFDFFQKYGDLGRSFIEAHHEIPETEVWRQTKLGDFWPVCSNCHEMLHRDGLKRVDALIEIIAQNDRFISS